MKHTNTSEFPAYFLFSFFILFSCLWLPQIAKSAPGELDTTFNLTGKKEFSFKLANDYAKDIAIQNDGKTIIIGQSSTITNLSRCSLLRLNIDGSLDRSFGENGFVFPLLRSGQGLCNLESVKIDNSDRIVVVGNNQINRSSVLVMRFDQNGNLDGSFGNDGIVLTKTGHINSNDVANDVLTQDDGKIITVGSSDISGSVSRDMTVVRYNENGTLDRTFGSKGIVAVDFYGSTDNGESISFDSKDRILICGNARNGRLQPAIARILSDGSLDESFGTNGKVSNSYESTFSFNSVATQSDGKIIAGGMGVFGFNSRLSITRFEENGDFDFSFGDEGIAKYPQAKQSILNSIRIASDDKIIVAGGIGNSTDISIAVLRFDRDGYIDGAFADNGSKQIKFGKGRGTANAVAIGADGKITLAGNGEGTKSIDFAVARLNVNGSDDESFNNSGKLLIPIASMLDEGKSIALQSDGKIVQAGDVLFGNRSHAALVRYNLDGTLDKTFGNNGEIIEQTKGGGSFVSDLFVQQDDKILLLTYEVVSSERIQIIRYNPNGEIDKTFGVNGFVSASFNETDGRGNRLAIQSDGKIIIGGEVSAGGRTVLGMTRLNYDGTLDKTFGNNGRVFDPGGTPIKSLALQNDGKIVVVGNVVMRYFADGSPDKKFGENGIVSSNVPAAHSYNSVAIQPDEKIIVALDSGFKFVISRLNPDGTLDENFGQKGVVQTQISEGSNSAENIVLQADGKIVVGGNADVQVGKEPGLWAGNFAVLRYNYDGSLDTQWGENGVMITDAGRKSYAMSLDMFERVIIGGISFNANFVTVRLQSDTMQSF